MNLQRLAAIVAPLILCAASAYATPGQPGTLDATWGAASPLGAGKVVTSLATFDRIYSVAVQPDGKVVAAGDCYANNNDSSICIARYLPDGTLDASFNGTGYSQHTFEAGTNSGRGLALQKDGRIVVAGTCPTSGGGTYQFCALRLNSDGTLDTSFNGTGKIVASLSLQNQGYATAIQADGKILIAGYCFVSINRFCLLRFNSDGTPDTSFNGTGSVTTQLNSDNAFAYAMALQPDGKIVLAGSCTRATVDFCLARYLPDGSVDSSFNGTGQQTFVVGPNTDIINAIAIQPDGKIVVVGDCYTAGLVPNFCGARLLPNGLLDFSFQASGRFMQGVANTTESSARGLYLQPSGKFIVVGRCYNNTTDYFCANQYHSDGQLDLAVNGNGSILTPMTSGIDGATAIAVQADGKLLLAGACSTGANGAGFCIARYDGGPFGYRACSPDLDGDGAVLATTDVLIQARVALGMTGAAVVSGINFATYAARKTWPEIRDYLTWQCGMSLPQ